jgi:hypothetical protein
MAKALTAPRKRISVEIKGDPASLAWLVDRSEGPVARVGRQLGESLARNRWLIRRAPARVPSRRTRLHARSQRARPAHRRTKLAGCRDPDEPEPPGGRPGTDSGLSPTRCAICDEPLVGKYSNAKTCGERCRQRLHRERAALLKRYDAALGIVKALKRYDDRVLLLAAVVWPTDERLAARNLREAA